MFTRNIKQIFLISFVWVFLILWLLYAQPRKMTVTLDTQKQVQGQQMPQRGIAERQSQSAQDPLTNFHETDFYRTIIDNNLFRPLGWRPLRPREPYRLLGTLIATDGNIPPQAIVQNTTTKKIHIGTLGEKLDADTTLINIQPKEVTLEKAGEQRTLTLNPTPLIK